MSADEFDIIARYFAPLAKSAAARGLLDDAAVFDAKGMLVITTDAIVEGVHFLSGDPIDTVAKKALRVNLSDLAAKGAKPVAVVLSLIWPDQRPASEIAAFAAGLGEDLEHYGVALLGGDTTSTPGPLTVSITAFGAPFGATIPARADARAGEHVWVTGYIGDAFLGLKSLTDEPAILGATHHDQVDALVRQARSRYRAPDPPVAFAQAIAAFASASIDVSDGLLADAEKIAEASRVALRIDAEAVPLLGGESYVRTHGNAGLVRLLTAGDDYQALFTAKPEHRVAILAAGRELGINVSLIGDVSDGVGVRLVDGRGDVLCIPTSGHRHRLGR